MKTNEIRQKYLEFFQGKGHTIVPSDVLVPKWDKTVLFTPAGMNQFKDHFLGKVTLEYTRATTSQKCLRTGDIENVGRTAYHHTFFEMLGNFSFGDYFKREAIHWAWEFLTDKQWLAINPNQLTVSVYLDDDEAANIWHNEIGLSLDRIARLGEHDNFWPAGAPTDGPDGVCGPCSEIFFHPENGPECEIWNLVFTQFNRQGDPPNNLIPLPNKNIDTGMGLERIAATMQGASTNFHIDTLRPIVDAAAAVVGVKYDPLSENGRRLRRIADHVRACTMAIHENVYPGANKEEYVIRRLLRRAVLQGHEMGLREPFLFQIVPEVIAQMSQPYPELRSTADRVAQVIKNEESNFFGSLDDGLAKIESIFSAMQTAHETTVRGAEAAELYQTFGIPAELFAGIAEDRNLKFDWPGYQAAMDQHGVTSGKGSKGVMGDFGPIDDIKRELKSTEFLGYESTSATGLVRGLVQQVAETKGPETNWLQRRQSELAVQTPDAAAAEQFVVLDRTPFYAESGGQVGDSGFLVGPAGKFAVTDTQKNGDVFVHLGHVTEGVIRDGERVSAVVDEQRRDAIRRSHSATHVLHYALQQNLGEHAQQRGSKVVEDALRFDFSNLTAVSPAHLSAIEKLAIAKIEAGGAVAAEILPLEQAKQAGAMMLFGEKYPDPVRMISIGDFSKELCGGNHVKEIGDVLSFEIVSEESVSSGTRRIQAITGAKAIENQRRIIAAAIRITENLSVTLPEIPMAVAALAEQVKLLKKQLTLGKESSSVGNRPASVVARNSTEIAVEGSNYFAIREIMRTAAGRLNVPVLELADRVAAMQAETQALQKRLEQLNAAGEINVDEMIEKAEIVGDFKLIVAELPGIDPNQLKPLVDQIRKKINSVAVFFATSQGADKVLLVAGISRDLVERGLSAGDWIKEVAPIVGGGGGGKADLAQAGGKDPAKIGSALEAARTFLQGRKYLK